MANNPVRSITILGGGAAGWMTAALLIRQLPPAGFSVTVVESEEIGIIGVGEASVPILRQFNAMLDIDDHEFLRLTQGSYKLGIEFRDWGRPGNVHFHGFGDYGKAIEGVLPYQYWLRLREQGDAEPIDDYSYPYAVARRNKFTPAEPGASNYLHAFHFDATLYARALRGIAEGLGVTRIEGKMVEAVLDGETGDIRTLRLSDGQQVPGDLFIDCTGFAAALIGKALGTRYIDWSHWLPADRALAVPCAPVGQPTPFTRATARKAGWQWRIPLQHRTGNGLVYSSSFMSDDDAREELLANIEGPPQAEPRSFRFRSGRHEQFWNRNCVAIGFAAGFLEPLESTGIQLIQTAIGWLIEYFPKAGIDPAFRDEYNRITGLEMERIRDFIIAHYCVSRRDEPLWAMCREMDLPDTLKYKLKIWENCGRLPLFDAESHQLPSWVAILIGNGFIPKNYDVLADRVPLDRLRQGMAGLRAQIARAAAALPDHGAYLDRNCRAGV
ncbi:tryptophan 7-halogenase [Sphingomonas oligophenolica]|uniref:Tryptophan halogenase family protein n=1 Tax=Sphingomonas oligophenolica TaxID=301154 RepID=A0ABU9Y7F5_9SPHN